VSTADRLLAAAAELLDGGGEAAVTLRAVGSAVGLSHNAPYKHFASRDDLLAAVATADFGAVAEEWRRVRKSDREPIERLLDALEMVVRFSREHPARHRLLFGSPVTASCASVTRAADEALDEFAGIVQDCQRAGVLPAAPRDDLAVLLVATTHGLIGADTGGRLRPRTGWPQVGTGLQILVRLLSNSG
jgi:AcrR family transcriptional regulator